KIGRHHPRAGPYSAARNRILATYQWRGDLRHASLCCVWRRPHKSSEKLDGKEQGHPELHGRRRSIHHLIGSSLRLRDHAWLAPKWIAHDAHSLRRESLSSWSGLLRRSARLFGAHILRTSHRRPSSHAYLCPTCRTSLSVGLCLPPAYNV